MECLWVFIIGVFGIIVVIAYESKADIRITKRLQDEIETKGGHLIEARKVVTYYQDRTYEVVFRNASGQQVTVSCKVDWRNDRIYWEIPLGQLLMQSQSSGHTVLEQLNRPLGFTRLAAVRELATHKQISDEVRAKLAQMAVDDEDPQVRDEAKTLVRGF